MVVKKRCYSAIQSSNYQKLIIKSWSKCDVMIFIEHLFILNEKCKEPGLASPVGERLPTNSAIQVQFREMDFSFASVAEFYTRHLLI